MCVIALLLATTKVVEGMLLGMLMVMGIFTVIVSSTMLRRFALGVGYWPTVVGTGWLTHTLIGTGTLAGVFAVAWALVLKMFVLDLLRWWDGRQEPLLRLRSAFLTENHGVTS